MMHGQQQRAEAAVRSLIPLALWSRHIEPEFSSSRQQQRTTSGVIKLLVRVKESSTPLSTHHLPLPQPASEVSLTIPAE